MSVVRTPVLPVAAVRAASRDGGTTRRRWPRLLLLLHARGDSAEAGRRRRDVDLRPDLPLSDSGGRRHARRCGCAARVRFKVLDGETAFDDLVHGRIAFDNPNIEDFVVLRSDGQPALLARVVSKSRTGSCAASA